VDRSNTEVKIGDYTKEPVANPKVLVIADETLGGMIVECLRPQDYDVIRMESYGRYDHIIEAVRKDKLSLAILTNNTMNPPMTLELLAIIRTMETSLTVLVLSGFVDFAFAKRLNQLGAADLMAMPFDEEELVATVKRLTTAV
jgi:DNA-binding NtrC family response regulator